MAKVGGVMVGANNIERAKDFYDAVLGVIGIGRLMEHPSGGRVYAGGGDPMFSVVRPFNGEAATAGNGTMVSFSCASPEDVAGMHAKALEMGGTCEGPPGPRGDTSFYAAYFRDPEGNKICAFHWG